MRTLLLQLAGPLQAWGDSSRFTERRTRREPTKSGVLGMLAAAQGRRRTDPVEDLIILDFAVRVDQEGTVLSDFHTAINWETGLSMPLSRRHYLADAVFVAGVGGPPEVIDGLADAVRSPVWAPFLGRRACPPSRPVFLGVADSDVWTAVRKVPWQASRWYRRRHGDHASLRMCSDAQPGDTGQEAIRDVPQSYDPRRRQHGWREVVEERVAVGASSALDEPDFISAVEV